VNVFSRKNKLCTKFKRNQTFLGLIIEDLVILMGWTFKLSATPQREADQTAPNLGTTERQRHCFKRDTLTQMRCFVVK